MMYKLINRQTGEQYLCDKVTIDGYDYYLSDETTKQGDKWFDGTNIRNDYSLHLIDGFDRKVIATNNSNIDDVPKVVDEVERLASNVISCSTNVDIQLVKEVWKAGYNKSQETHPFSEEDVRFMLSESFKASHEGYQITSDEIIQLWKEQQPKTLYYE